MAFEPEASGWKDVFGLMGGGGGVGGPPQIAVAAGLGVGPGVGGVGDPLGGDDLSAGPVAVVEIEKGEAGHIAGGHAHGIGGETRFRAADVVAVFGAEVLHADGCGDLGGEGFVDGVAGGFFVDGAEGIEVPVVVVPEGAGRVGAALWALVGHAGGFVLGLVV